jgi:hypothetical protein
MYNILYNMHTIKLHVRYLDKSAKKVHKHQKSDLFWSQTKKEMISKNCNGRNGIKRTAKKTLGSCDVDPA